MDSKRQLLEVSKKERQQQHISCLITGISFDVLLPAHSELPQHKRNHYKFHFCQQHPLSGLEEALSFAALSSRELAEFDETLIAGAILSIFHHWNIREDMLSAHEANLILSYGRIETLYASLHFLSSINARIAKHIPHISLAGTDTGTIGTWLWAARSALELPIERTAIQKPSIKKTGILIHSVESETRTAARAILATLKPILAPKLYTILTASIPGNTLATMSEALRSNLITGLGEYIELEPAAASFIKILKDTKNNASVQERILTQQLDSYERFSTDYQPNSLLIPKKKTIQEILAERIAGKAVGQVQVLQQPMLAEQQTSRISTVKNLLLDLSDEIDSECKEHADEIDISKENSYEGIPEEIDFDSIKLDAEPALFDLDSTSDIEEQEAIADYQEEEGDSK